MRETLDATLRRKETPQPKNRTKNKGEKKMSYHYENGDTKDVAQIFLKQIQKTTKQWREENAHAA